ncbi:MAG: hypothetical protein R3C44_00655 [Chloroflexota bacterium]
MAPYLWAIQIDVAASRLTAVFATGDQEAIRDVCADIMYAHLSTRERLPILDTFYRDIFAVTGHPQRLLDIGSGLNPLALRWMDLSPDASYLAYDIHEPRVAFLNHYFELEGCRRWR